MVYDIIGDIHGQADKLKGLLTKLGYRHNGVCYIAPKGHQAVFIGDLIDRGNQELATLFIVFDMIDNKQAIAVMGNHEYNAIGYATPNTITNDGSYLRVHSQHNTHQHQAFLDEVGFNSKLHRHWISRLYELPLWIETPHAIFIHACYDTCSMRQLQPLLTQHNQLTEHAVQLMGQPNTPIFFAAERLLKGIDVPLPKGITKTDKTGISRTRARVKWWEDDWQNRPISEILMADNLPNTTLSLSPDLQNFHINTDKFIFIGHYWLDGKPTPLTDQVVCIDYSAGKDGVLTAYRFDTNNPTLSADNFIW
ncbi:metallophosphoesterase [Moraxella nasovis]|uniref:metallophosphoesterase n=1 Tax=Moraxella nasovis TaxID=2904121 RepID=UPI001F5FF8D0|nr:metallophosphoesterase [Moraxella nasovis]UNU72786.1 metallophosphoesterase [Moraxella nasovis]